LCTMIAGVGVHCESVHFSVAVGSEGVHGGGGGREMGEGLHLSMVMGGKDMHSGVHPPPTISL
jgi:hypothetical protein